MSRNKIYITGIILAVFSINNLLAQQKDTSKINISTDFVSRYVWRGIDYGKTPSIQPTFLFTKGGFEIGAWGAFNTIGTYQEFDPYVKYTLKKITFTLSDYFVNDGLNTNNTHYFNYDELYF